MSKKKPNIEIQQSDVLKLAGEEHSAVIAATEVLQTAVHDHARDYEATICRKLNHTEDAMVKAYTANILAGSLIAGAVVLYARAIAETGGDPARARQMALQEAVDCAHGSLVELAGQSEEAASTAQAAIQKAMNANKKA